MKVFADTSYFIALLNGRDAAHEAAVAYSREAFSEVIVTQFVIIELGDGFCKPPDRPDFLSLIEFICGNPSYTVISASSELLKRGLELFAARADKAWSLTDCTSFITMTDERITDALSTDRHFLQAGFRALLLPN